MECLSYIPESVSVMAVTGARDRGHPEEGFSAKKTAGKACGKEGLFKINQGSVAEACFKHLNRRDRGGIAEHAGQTETLFAHETQDKDARTKQGVQEPGAQAIKVRQGRVCAGFKVAATIFPTPYFIFRRRRGAIAAFRSARDGATSAALWLRSGECVRGSRRTTGPLLPACVRNRRPCQTACG